MVKLAHCIHGLGLGGAQKVIAGIIRGRRDPRFEYYVYSCHEGAQRQEIEAAGATVRIIPRALPKLDPLWAWGLARQMRRDGIHLVHAHLFGDSLHGYLGARLAGGLPVVLTLHSRPEAYTSLQLRGYRWLLARSAATVACSAAVERAFSGRGLTAGRLLTIANGLEPPATEVPPTRRRELRSDLGASEETILIAAVGRMVVEKAYGDLIAAFARIRPELDTRLVLVGEGPLRQDLEAEARRLQLGDRVIFTGLRSDVPELLQAVDVVAFSSLFEGMPMVLLEAMAASRCVVTTDVPGILEAVRDDREALVVPAGDVASLTAALERVAADRSLRERLGAAAKQRFDAAFTADAMVRAYEGLYREVLESF